MDFPVGGIEDLARMLDQLRPAVVPGEFVFVCLAARADVDAAAVIVESEGVTHVVARTTADAHGWPYDFVAGWITLQVHSSLAAVGLTAAVSAALAGEGISSNMLAGYFHDHVLVPSDDVPRAMSVLERLATGRL